MMPHERGFTNQVLECEKASAVGCGYRPMEMTLKLQLDLHSSPSLPGLGLLPMPAAPLAVEDRHLSDKTSRKLPHIVDLQLEGKRATYKALL